jgi:purine nucleosidase
MHKVINKYPHNVIIISLTAKTNLYHLFKKYPKDIKLVKHHYSTGGSIQSKGNVTPFAEFNIYADPRAAEFVYQLDIPTTITLRIF